MKRHQVLRASVFNIPAPTRKTLPDKHMTQPNSARVLFPLGLGTALSLMGDATMYTVLPTHTADAGITLAAVGVMLGVNRAVRLFLNGPAGLAYDRWPRRRLFIPALFIGALSTALYALVRGFWPLLIARMLWGLAWSGIWVGGASMILDVTTATDRGRWTGFYQTWFFLGSALGSLSGGALTDAVGYTATMWIGATLTALGGVVALLLLPETRAGPTGKPAIHSPNRSLTAPFACQPRPLVCGDAARRQPLRHLRDALGHDGPAGAKPIPGQRHRARHSDAHRPPDGGADALQHALRADFRHPLRPARTVASA